MPACAVMHSGTDCGRNGESICVIALACQKREPAGTDGSGWFLARQKGFEPPTFRLGVQVMVGEAVYPDKMGSDSCQ